MRYDTIVIGGGQSGLATGYWLQRAGLSFRILEAGPDTAGSWPRYRDSLVLSSPARYDALPGLAFPGDPDHYPARDEVVAYLRRYAAHFRLPVATGAPVRAVEPAGPGFVVATGDGRRYGARTVVAATGFFGHPYVPALPGLERYRGQVLHVADYRRPEPFRGQRVVVVGGGNSAVEVAVELAGVARVSLATRRPIRWMPQRLLGRDIHAWLRALGLEQTQWLGEQSVPVYATPASRAALGRGQPDRRPLFAALSDDGVLWREGAGEAVDALIFATGYRPHLPYLAGLGAVGRDGRALQRGGSSTSVPGLFYVGLIKQRTSASTTIRGAAADAGVVVEAIRRFLQAGGAPARAAGRAPAGA